MSQSRTAPARAPRERDKIGESDDETGKKMEVLLELNLKQRTATRAGIVMVGIIIYVLFCTNSAKASLTLGALLTLMMRNPTIVYALVMTVHRDTMAFYRFLWLNVYLLRMERRNWIIARIFQQISQAQPHKSCFVMDERRLTFAQVQLLSNKVAAFFRSQRLERGDCVALLMDTRVEYPCFWLGLSQLGVITALINSNLRRDTLLHSIKVANARALIVGSELADVLAAIGEVDELRQLPIYQYSDADQVASYELLPGAVDLRSALDAQQPENLSLEIARGSTRDKLIYVFTSGTTGLPKAAVITNLRFLFMAAGTFYMLHLQKDDVVYNPLPLYHTAGGIVGIGNALLNGATVVLRKKFSASNFWRDCSRHECSVAQYIGELCRYLLATPYTTEQRQHSLRLMYGNGLRPQIWTQFVSRFGIPQIGEVYGATEGNSNLINITNRVGAIGFVPVFGRSIYPVQVIRCDEQTGDPLRDSEGRCTRCKPGEPGLLIGKVDSKRAVSAFHGYADKGASEQKLLRNVYSKGDVFFNSGDMVVCDILGYFYFKDRTGDTFRWRGENVATQEVEAIITNCIGLSDCVVYGVQIPHVEGKAGMAAIVDPSRKVDMEYLSTGIRGSLPAYARPLFIRLLDEIPRTATFKLKKRELALEGYDLSRLSDPIFYLNRDGIYRRLTSEQYQALQAGTAGL
ncbi:long-chain fatty acid transport protein 4 [Scaptodrosophila lebanonensis]|uniref:Very long-chain fatty acid transport protein n=1 Tax=Drosophila lebanonensis TaxID=7225 RepID=A0A6J2TI19_DROLE|nr:long-chain fatty acid transport protein 4 [Scaptodrosophila lebanonensis]